MTRERGIKQPRDENLYFLIYDTGGKAKSMHDRMIAFIVQCLYNRGFRKINYDHIKEFIKKSAIPLTVGGRRWDIVVQYGKDRYALIEIKTMKIANDIIEEEIKEDEVDGNGKS